MGSTGRSAVIVVGAGGHGKVLIATLLAAGREVAMVLDDRPETWSGSILGVPVRGPVARLESMPEAVAILGIGDNAVRREISLRFPDIEWARAVHPGAHVHASARLGPGTVVFAGAVVQPEAEIGAHVIVNTSASIDHDCVIGDFVHVAPGAHLSGGVRIGEGTLMGIGSAAIPGVRVGSWTSVGAGGVVVRDLPDRVTAVGAPARPRAARG